MRVGLLAGRPRFSADSVRRRRDPSSRVEGPAKTVRTRSPRPARSWRDARTPAAVRALHRRAPAPPASATSTSRGGNGRAGSPRPTGDASGTSGCPRRTSAIGRLVDVQRFGRIRIRRFRDVVKLEVGVGGHLNHISIGLRVCEPRLRQRGAPGPVPGIRRPACLSEGVDTK